MNPAIKSCRWPVFLLFALYSSLAVSQVVPSGMYELAISTGGNRMATSVCYREQDVKALASLLLSLEEPLMRKDCVVDVTEQSLGSANWTMRCKNQFVTRITSGDIEWRDATFKGQALRTMGAIKMAFSFEAHRTAACQ